MLILNVNQADYLMINVQGISWGGETFNQSSDDKSLLFSIKSLRTT